MAPYDLSSHFLWRPARIGTLLHHIHRVRPQTCKGDTNRWIAIEGAGVSTVGLGMASARISWRFAAPCDLSSHFLRRPARISTLLHHIHRVRPQTCKGDANRWIAIEGAGVSTVDLGMASARITWCFAAPCDLSSHFLWHPARIGTLLAYIIFIV